MKKMTIFTVCTYLRGDLYKCVKCAKKHFVSVAQVRRGTLRKNAPPYLLFYCRVYANEQPLQLFDGKWPVVYRLL